MSCRLVHLGARLHWEGGWERKGSVVEMGWRRGWQAHGCRLQMKVRCERGSREKCEEKDERAENAEANAYQVEGASCVPRSSRPELEPRAGLLRLPFNTRGVRAHSPSPFTPEHG